MDEGLRLADTGSDMLPHQGDAEIGDDPGDLAIDQSGATEPAQVIIATCAFAVATKPQRDGEVVLDGPVDEDATAVASNVK